MTRQYVYFGLLILAIILVVFFASEGIKRIESPKTLKVDTTHAWMNTRNELANVRAQEQKLYAQFLQSMKSNPEFARVDSLELVARNNFLMSPQMQQLSTYEQMLMQIDEDSVRVRVAK